MLQILGGIGVGLVNGWLAARLMYQARWTVIVYVLLWLIAQSIVILGLTSPVVLLWFAGALFISALLCIAWLRLLQARYGSTG
ncbi:MAG TPA: hypothetical protein VKE41_00615 [Roseiflexaceae bacterium]|nr:hypothetical protein [Roseiflexaceae bacterium]